MLHRRQRTMTKAWTSADLKITMGSLAIAVCLVLLFFASSFDGALVNSTSPLIWQLGLATVVTLPLARLLRWIPLSRAERHVLIVGTNDLAQKLAKTLRRQPANGYRLTGFVSEKPAAARKKQLPNVDVVADLASLAEFLRHNVVDEVFLALPEACHSAQSQPVLQLCEKQGITVRLPLSVPPLSVPNLELAQPRLTQWFYDIPVMTLQANTMVGVPGMAKRVFDIVGSVMLLVVLTPLLLVVAAAIKLTSAGPVLFVQERVGLGKRRFPLLKFRTMVVDAEEQLPGLESLNEAQGPVFKITEDPRITSLGKCLRQTSIDELPQLVNVLRGDMSLVGPRPLPVRDVDGFEKDSHRRRFTVPPGLTCLWQIGGRSNVKFEEWMNLDMKYIDEWSLWLDFKILVRTVPAVFKRTGAA